MNLNDYPWFGTLDPFRQGLITEIGMDRLNKPIRDFMQYGNWVGAAFEVWNSRRLNRDMGITHCHALADALEFGHWLP